MNKIFVLLLAIFASIAFPASDEQLVALFERDSSQLEIVASEFQALIKKHPELNHIDLEDYSPRYVDISLEELASMREKMASVGLLSVLRGDFSGKNLDDTTYMIADDLSDHEFGIQRGFLKTSHRFDETVEKLGTNRKMEGIEFKTLSENWYLYERTYDHELY